MKIIVSHPTGNRNVRAVLESFAKSKLLTEFNTTIAVDEGDYWLKLLPNKLKKEFLRRTYPVLKGKICKHPFRELCRIILPKFGVKGVTKHETGWASIESVYQNLDKAVAKRLSYYKKRNAVTGIYAYEDGALSSFKKAKELEVTCIYDLPIAYWKTVKSLLQDEAERLPAWKNTLGGGNNDSQIKLDRKTKELELADIIITPSQFVADSLPIWAKEKQIVLSPFGSPDIYIEDTNVPNRKGHNRPLRVLFAGSLGQRKGLGDLFAAMKLIRRKDVELVVMGSLLDSIDFYRQQLHNFTYEEGRPHADVLALMRSCDVFCLPSIVEGRALVMQEAMSQGLPLIITPNTGGEDLIITGKTGFVVPIRNSEAIAEKLEWFANNRDETQAMGEEAKQYAANYSWEQYGQYIINALSNN